MRERDFLIVIYLIAIGMGIVFILFNPHSYGPGGFDGYDALGWNIAAGNGYSFNSAPPFEPTAFRLPGYALVVAAIYRIFGHHYLAVHIIQLLINALIPVIIYYTVKILHTDRLARISSIVVAVGGISNLYVSTVVTEVFTVFITVLHTLLFVLAVRRCSYKWFFLSGIVMGYGILTRPGLALLPIFYIFFLLFFLRPSWMNGKGAAGILVYMVSMLFLFLPWTIRNYTKVYNPVLLGTQGGSQLFYGTLESGEYFRKRFANPLAHYENMTAYAYNSRAHITFDVIMRNDTYTPFIYYAINSDKFVSGRMVPYGAGRYVFHLPSPTVGTSIKYYFELNNENKGAAHVRFPFFAPNSTFRYYIVKNIFSDIDVKDEFMDIYDFVECVRVASSPASASARILRKYDYNRDGRVGFDDVNSIAWAICHYEGNQLYDFNKIINTVWYVADGITIGFIDGSNMVIPEYFDRSYEKVHIFAAKGTAFDILNGFVNVSALRVSYPVSIGLYGPFASAGADRFGINSELNRQFLQRKLALFIIMKNPVRYMKTCVKRMFFMWITLGSRDISVSHPPPGGHYIYFKLAAFISTAILLIGILGILLSMRELKAMGYMLVSIIYFPLTHSLVMANARHTLPVNPYILIFGSIAVIKAYDFFTNGGSNLEKS